MKKLFFAFLVATLSVVSAFAESKNFQEEPVEWSHSLLATKEDSKTYEINEDGYKQGSILISYNNTIAVGSVTISIYNASGVRIGGVVVRPEQLKKNTFREFTFSSNTGEDIKKVVVHFVGSYKRTYKDLILTKSSITNKKYCLVKRIDEKKQYTAGWWSNKNVIYDLANIPTNYTKQLVFSARTSDYSALVDEGEFVIKVLRRGGDGYEVLQGWDAYTNGFCHISTIYVVEIPHNVVSVMFSNNGNSGASLDRIVEYVEIYKDNILKSDKNQLDFGSVLLGKSKTLEFTLDYVNIYELSKSLSAYSNCFSIDYTPAADCAEGTQTVKVTFTPSNCVENYDATLTFYNGKTVTINLTGARVRNSGTVSEITWTGAVDTNWDNRANWKKADGNGNVLSVADVLDEKLKVNIPAGLTQYPVIPDVSTAKAFKEDRDKACDCAQVNAGDNATATMIADKIYMKSGAALVGVETLNVGTLRYNEVEIDFIPVRCYKDDKDSLRYDWTLVGPVVKPWNEDKPGETRNVVSGDYFLQDLPHVYMHKAEVKKDPKTGLLSAMWNESFPDLDVDLTHERAFAIRIPDQYGRNMDWWGMKFEKLPAEVYNSLFLKEGETPYDGTAPHTYTFRGRFYNDASLPTYTLAEYEKPYVLNNSYPANIDAEKLSEGLNRPVQIYDYKSKAFVTLDEATDKSIISQSSFVVIAKENNETIEIKKDWFETSETGRRSASVDSESFRIELRNDAKSSASEIYVCYDELKEDEKNYSFDAPKIFNKMESSLPDLYTIRYNAKWSGLVIPTISEPIPLGINVNSENQSFTFSLKKTTMSSDVILEDRLTNTQYNLSAGETCQVDNLGKGLNEGRFYLLLSEQEDPDVSTDIEDATIGNIDIYSQGNSVVVSSTSDIELMQVIVSDMAGRSQVYNVSDNYAQINLPIEAGVYTISVVGDKATRVEKIKLN